ncbi:MAG: serine/threonine-protein kinase [Planctomycetaceae bacterium]
MSDDLLDELLALCLEAERLGVPIDRSTLLARHPDLAEELAAFLDGNEQFKRLAAPLRDAGPAGAAGPAAHSNDTDDGCLRLGKYRLIRELGRGGMGVVYEAWQEGVNRPVAVKVISAGPFATAEELKRFRTEAEAAANLSHPGLVPIYEVDVCDGRPFYSMELVEGQSLADLAASGPVPYEKAAGLVASIAEALDYAHQRGVVHRDLKPANVLIDVRGRPRVTDFGLAKRLERGDGGGGETGDGATRTFIPRSPVSSDPPPLTRTGAVLGTPAYMAPEQAAGKRTVGPAADVYGLGAILYHLLTGRPPFKAPSAINTLQLVIDGRLEPVRQLRADVPRDLAIITETCLQREPSDRYRTAAAVADDLRRYLAGEPIQAGGISVWGRLTRVVGQSRHVSHFRLWGRAIVAFGIIVFLAHLVMHLIDRAGVTDWWVFLPPRLAMFALLVGVLRWSRSGSLLPRDAVERLVWVVWTAYLLAFGAAGLVTAAAGGEHVGVYPFAAVLAGMAFFTLGCHVWGACYLVGLAFFAAAPLLVLMPDYAVLGFGVLWGLSLTSLGLRYQRLNRTLPVDE